MTRFAAFLRNAAIVVAAVSVGAFIVVANADARTRAAPQSYLIEGQRYFVYQWQRPGFVGVHVGVRNPNTQSANSVLTQQLGDMPPYYRFEEAARIYLAQNFGRCQLTGHRYIWQGEIRFSFACR